MGLVLLPGSPPVPRARAPRREAFLTPPSALTPMNKTSASLLPSSTPGQPSKWDDIVPFIFIALVVLGFFAVIYSVLTL